jgi:hypothetical protein
LDAALYPLKPATGADDHLAHGCLCRHALSGRLRHEADKAANFKMSNDPFQPMGAFFLRRTT